MQYNDGRSCEILCDKGINVSNEPRSGTLHRSPNTRLYPTKYSNALYGHRRQTTIPSASDGRRERIECERSRVCSIVVGLICAQTIHNGINGTQKNWVWSPSSSAKPEITHNVIARSEFLRFFLCLSVCFHLTEWINWIHVNAGRSNESCVLHNAKIDLTKFQYLFM